MAQMGIVPQSEWLPIEFLVRAHAWVAGQVPGAGLGMCERQPINISLPLFLLSSPLSKNNT